MKSRLPLLLLITIQTLLIFSCKNEEEPYLVILSIDGFRWDYPDSIPTPNLDAVAAGGVKAISLKPSFPTKTFPNHYTMATGLYPDHHGIVQNSFLDPGSNRHYAINDREAVEDGFFYAGEPIWVSAEKQGVRSASYFWVGSEALIEGYQPSITKKYDWRVPFEDRLDSVITWLQLPEGRRPRLIMWYMNEPDHTAHEYGPFSTETREMIMYQDSLLGIYLERIAALPIADRINIIITSDHGMQASNPDSTEYLEDYINERWIKGIQGYNPNFIIQAMEGCTDSIFESLGNARHLSIWKYGEVPAPLNYGTNPRCKDLIICADSAWRLKAKRDKHPGNYGDHGYDNRNTDMHAIFYAKGPAFKKGYVQAIFENVDLYPLMAYVLGLNPAEVDGSIENVREMLIE